MNFIQLKCYWAVVSTGSFSLAAEKLFMSQSAVSKNVLSLEKELGVMLLNRNGKYFNISKYGQMLMPYFRELLETQSHISDALEEIKSQRESKNQTIRFASVPTIVIYGIVASIKHFISMNPNVQFLTEEMEEERLLYVVESGGCDLAFCSNLRLDRSLVNSRFYCKDTFMLVVPMDSPLAGKDSVVMADLENCNLILNRKESSLYDLCQNACREAGFEPNILFTTARPDIAFSYLMDKSNAYMCIKRMARTISPDTDIKAIPIEDAPFFEYHFVWPRNTPLSSPIKKYLSFVDEHSEDFLEHTKFIIRQVN